MNTIKAAVILFIAAGAGVAMAQTADSAHAAPTRAQVRQELQQAIANGGIRHGDLADFQDLVAPADSRPVTDGQRVEDRGQAGPVPGMAAAGERKAEQRPAPIVDTASSGR